MPAIKIDPAQPITFAITFHSPHVVAYRLWYKRPGDEKPSIFATGTDDETSNPSTHMHTVGPLPPGSEIRYLVWLSGNSYTAYRIEIEVLQNGQPVQDGAFSLRGTTDEDGFDQRKNTLELTV
ncbi:hypothetical protein [Hymenobacter sp. HDW8]|uniref:hypothetical protein n=1 Tax=Hymenobacter sp. HDW8 TaxID=2714932 RepID=UPI00140C4E42|nr:hypothetical protein [Hymenobacter sp. HDW8]QIL76329.1 hypothetical protein G7064_10995 [Hymenobacter sp. HDW8]